MVSLTARLAEFGVVKHRNAYEDGREEDEKRSLVDGRKRSLVAWLILKLG